MPELELVLVLLVVVTALIPIAGRLRVPYPVLLVVAGLVLALLPIFPDVPIEPDLVFLLFLPPLLYSAAYNTSIRDLRSLMRPIFWLAVGLVLVTTAVVAVLLHALMPELGWPVAFAFGAIVSPPDAVAAAAVFRELGVPRRIVALLEGESLINDATALVTYRAAVAAIAVSFSFSQTAISFPVVAIGGVLIGLVVGTVVGWLRQMLNDPPVEIALSLLTPFAAYLPAEHLGLSGVLATVTAGLYLGWREPYISQSATRLSSRAVWDMIDFVLNGLVFILIGLQLSTILRALGGRSLLSGIGTGLLLSLAAILVRTAWVFMEEYVQWWAYRWPLLRNVRRRTVRQYPGDSENAGGNEVAPRWRELIVVGWAGMRGVVSLATALALPGDTPERDLLIFMAFVVILVTLVGQGSTLPLLIRALGVGVDHMAVAQQSTYARRAAVDAALSRISQLGEEWPTHLPLIEALRSQYEHRATHLEPAIPPTNGDGASASAIEGEQQDPEQELIEHHVIRRAVIDAERSAVLRLRERGRINDEIWREIERELDLEELRMDA